MCGIVGVASSTPMTVQMKDFFQSLLYHDIVRGAHATGVAAIDTLDRSLAVVKKAQPADVFLRDAEHIEQLFAAKHNFNIYIGHNRFATMGDKAKDENAHPFIHGDLVGVHNGSLRDQSLLDDHRKFEVDSDNLYYHLSRNGLDATLPKINGAFALVWYDRSDNTLNFIRNDERPMAVGKLTNGCLVWASEAGMLRWLIGRHRSLTFDTTKIEGQDTLNLVQLEKGVHVKFQFADKSRAVPKPTLCKKELKTFPSYSDDYDWGRYYGNSRQTNRPHTSVGSVSRTAHQLKMDKVIQTFLPEGDSSSYIEVKFVKHITPTNKFGAKANMSLYHYRDRNGVDHLFHAYNHNNNPASNFTEEDVGRSVFGQIGSVLEHSTSTYEEISCPNTGNHNMSLFSLSLTQPSGKPVFKYWTDEMIRIRNASCGIQQKKPEAGTQEEKKGAEVIPFERGSRLAEVKPETISFANVGEYPASKVKALMNNNNYCCANCAQRLGNHKLTRIYLHEHFDQEQGTTYKYLTCSYRCHQDMVEYTEEIDKDYRKAVGLMREE